MSGIDIVLEAKNVDVVAFAKRRTAERVNAPLTNAWFSNGVVDCNLWKVEDEDLDAEISFAIDIYAVVGGKTNLGLSYRMFVGTLKELKDWCI